MSHPRAARARRRYRPRDIHSRLQRLFSRLHDGWGPRDLACDHPDLVRGFTAGRIQMRMIHLPASVCAEAEQQKPMLHGTESLRHARMKLAAEAWMRGEGASDAQQEARCLVGQADCFSAARQWVVEVGNTPLRKLRVCVENPAGHRFTLIPYQRPFWRDGSVRPLIAADFAWDPSLWREIEEAAYERACHWADALDLNSAEETAVMRACRKASWWESSALPASAGRN